MVHFFDRRTKSMKDFSSWEEYEGASEGSGRSTKIWLMNPDTNQTGLFKRKKDNETTDHVSECIASDLAKLIEIPCARFEIGAFREWEGSMSYNIVEDEGMQLVEGIYCISMLYSNFDVERLMDLRTGERYSLEMIKKVLDMFNLFDEFLPNLVFDFLIGNTDRHQSNWALILKNRQFRLSPLYDNSSSLCAYIPESRIEQYLGNDTMLWRSLVDTKSKSIIRLHSNDEKLPTHTTVLRFLSTNYSKQIENIVNNIDKFVTKNSICDILEKYTEVLSEKKKQLILKFFYRKRKL